MEIQVIVLNGNSEIGAQIRTRLCYLISSGHLMNSKQRFFSPDLNVTVSEPDPCTPVSSRMSNVEVEVLAMVENNPVLFPPCFRESLLREV